MCGAACESLSSGQNPVSLLVGPQIGFHAGAGRIGGGQVDIEEQTESTDWGLVIGMSATVGKFVVLDGRYTWGLSNINADPEDNRR